jgi:hypothetical protein
MCERRIALIMDFLKKELIVLILLMDMYLCMLLKVERVPEECRYNAGACSIYSRVQ